ncbi:hypothetical protein D3C81_1498280 [compost metagenome]
MAVGVEAERQLTAQLPLDVVAVLFGLLTTNGGITAGLLGLNYCQRLAVFAEQDVVTELMTFVGCTWLSNAFGQAREDVKLFNNLSGIVDDPARSGKLLINQLRPGLCFGFGHE